MNDVPNWVWQGIATNLAADGLIALPWLAYLAWKHRAKTADWYRTAHHQLTEPFRDTFNESATITVRAVGVTKSRYDPYSGEWITVSRNFG